MREPFPFSAIVGQEEMKRALMIAAVDPTVGGVLVFGDRGTGKSTAVRALAALLPAMRVVDGCRYGCDPAGALCEECLARPAPRGEHLAAVAVVDMPLGATEDRVVGALDLERALTRGERAFEPGLLARANRGFLYIDEVNLLEDHLVDLLIDVASSGENVVEREGLSVRHPARFVLVGSGNPEEGELRPQLLDRFGLSVEVSTPTDIASRIDIVRRRDAYDRDAAAFCETWRGEDARLRQRIEAARALLPSVTVPDPVLEYAARLCIALGTDGLRAELTLLRAARALACVEGGTAATNSHVERVAPSALRHRLRRDPLDEAGSSVRVERAVLEMKARKVGGDVPSPPKPPVDSGGCGLTEGSVWDDARRGAALYAVDPAGLGGIAVRAQAGPVRERFLALLPGPRRRMPGGIADDALLGGLDLAATLQAGRPMRTLGLLAEVQGGTLLATMAERMPSALAARLAAAIDGDAGFGIVALDEGAAPDERAAPALLDRLAFHIDLSALSQRETAGGLPDADALDAARTLLPLVTADDTVVEALCGTALALAIDSPRAVLLAIKTARAAAALAGRDAATVEDAALAARLVLAPRATQMPAPPPDQEQEVAPPAPQEETEDVTGRSEETGESERLSESSEIVLEAARAAIPAGLLARLQAQDFRGTSRSQGREGARQKGAARGRPVGVRAASPGAGLRLNLIETLRAAAPWQRMRAADVGRTSVKLRREDFRVTRTEQRARSTTIFVVDASGSSALNRLAEAKGAVELLLADCYRRRDEVAVLAFRGRAAQLLLPPTRSLVRAKRSLASLPGGGGTPLAAGIEAGFSLAEMVRRGGCTPTVVLLTDGRANVTRAGTGGRAQAGQDAMVAARRLRASGVSALVLDISPRPGTEAGALARAMGALYVPLPYADAAGVSRAVRDAARR